MKNVFSKIFHLLKTITNLRAKYLEITIRFSVQLTFRLQRFYIFIFLVFTLSKPENVANRTKNGSQFEFYARLTEKQGQVPKMSKSSY